MTFKTLSKNKLYYFFHRDSFTPFLSRKEEKILLRILVWKGQNPLIFDKILMLVKSEFFDNAKDLLRK